MKHARLKRPTKPRLITVQIEGRTYHIPELWLVAATSRMTLPKAILHWHIQRQLEEEALCGR